MFRMIRYFFSLRNPFGTYRFPYCLYQFPLLFWNMIKDLFHWLTKGYPQCFTWNIDLTTAHFILPLVKFIKERKSGIPASLFPDGCELDEKAYEEIYRQSAIRWDETLDKIIYALDGILRDSPTEKWELVKNGGGNTDRALDAMHREQAKISEGLALLGKYFDCLWW